MFFTKHDFYNTSILNFILIQITVFKYKCLILLIKQNGKQSFPDIRVLLKDRITPSLNLAWNQRLNVLNYGWFVTHPVFVGYLNKKCILYFPVAKLGGQAS